jgi:hypothetical protein
MIKVRKTNVRIFIFICICVVGVWLLNPSFAQTQDRERPRFEIESDPLAYIFSGYSLHTAITYSGFRSSIGIFAIRPPEFLLENEAFSVYTSGYDLKTDYLFGDIKGFYAGIQFTYSKDRIELKEEPIEKDELRGLNLGIRAGYRFMFGKKENQHKGFYLTPWVALMYNPSPKSVQQRGQDYRQASWVPFPTIHLGWRF